MEVCSKIHFYFDYKSPFSYLAKNLTKELEESFPESVKVFWYPNEFSIKDDLGYLTKEQTNN